MANNIYEDLYKGKDYYWGKKVSPTCFKVLQQNPPIKPFKLLDIGCGEGQNAVFFARNGYNVSAFDAAEAGVEKTLRLADQVGVRVNAFQADIIEYRLYEYYDILFSTGVLHYIPAELRQEIFTNYKEFTNVDGIHMFSVFVKKPFIAPSPEKEKNSNRWISGELFTYYHDWRLDYCTEEIFDCMSSGIPHQHCTDRLLAKKVEY